MNLAAGRRAVLWGGGLLIGSSLLAAAHQIRSAYELSAEHASRSLDTHARIVAEQSARTFQAVDIVLRNLMQQHREGRLQRLDDESLHRRLREQALGLVQIDGLLVARADGAMRAVSMGYPLAPDAPNLAEYGLFRQIRTESPGRLLVGNAGPSPVDGVWVFLIARRLENGEGAFDGVAAARGRVDYFQSFYRDIRLEPGTQVSLVHRNGRVLAQHPDAAAVGRPSELYLRLGQPHWQSGAPGRVRDEQADADRFVAVHPVPDYPVSVMLTRDAGLALAGWRDQAIATGWRTAALAGVALLLLVLLLRQLRRLEADMAERSRLEAQLRQAQKLEAIGTMAGGIAHDFNNILSAIIGFGEMAQGEARPGTAIRRHIDAVMNAGFRAKSLVVRILAFSRSGLTERAPVHVGSVLAEAIELVRGSLPHGVRLEDRLDTCDAAVLGDSTQIHQVVMNLCSNAVQSMSAGVVKVEADTLELPSGLVVATSTLRAGPYVRIRVEDTGSGMAPEVLERIFDPFFTTKEVGVGTGLGLSLVHGIVTDLGGGVAVESMVGAGTAFTVFLPRLPSDIAVPAEESAPLPQGSGQAVMLVDDEEPLVRLGEEMLARLGYEPVGYTSALRALEAFRAEPDRFDALLTDESMPGLTGCELAREVRTLRPDLPVLVVSGDLDPQQTAAARAAGACEVLNKPLLARDLAQALQQALAAVTLRTA
ncbi:ATP-binding protein [Ramlibacter henchirensis]|uniref:ATP-binding protein n=1 Tax=Ramlibacter henchirensis TaxID=204072 RepID=UPI001431599C|nr:ATP-binding protein [Ramlibacter henchirensis]